MTTSTRQDPSLRAIRFELAELAIERLRDLITNALTTDSDRLSIFNSITEGYCQTCGAPIEESTGQCKDLCNAR